jgi:hypothetical protein
MPKILFKRGLEADVPSLSEGEPGFATDSGKLYIGSGLGNVELAKKEDVDSLDVALKKGLFTQQETPPDTPVVGQIWLDTSDNDYQGTVFDSLNSQLAEKASLNGTVYIDSFNSFTEAVSYCLANNKILDLCTTTVTATPSYNGMQLCSIKNGTLILNDYVRFYVAANTLIQDMTFIDNYVYSKTTSVPANFDQVTLGWVIESLSGSSNNVTLRRVNSYSTDSRVLDGTYRTRGFINLKGSSIVIDECNINDCRNAIRMGINSTNVPQWSNIVIKNCNFKNVEQPIDLLNVKQVRVQNCSLVNTSTQQSNYSVLMGADFICSISSDDIYVSNIQVERPIERTVYIVNAKRFHLNGFNISYGGLGSGGGLKICGWGNDVYKSVDCIIENGYCGVTNGQYFDLYGVNGITIRNITTAVSGANIFAFMLNRCQNVTFSNVKASITGALIYGLAQQAGDSNNGDTGIEISGLTLRNCEITTTDTNFNYLISVYDTTGGTSPYVVFDNWNLIDCIINSTASTVSKYLFRSSNFGTVTNITVKNSLMNGDYLALYEFTNNTMVQYYASMTLFGNAKTNNYLYGIDMPNVINYLPKGTYTIDLALGSARYGSLSRDNSGNIVYKRTFNTSGAEYILRRIQSGKTLNFKAIVEVECDTFATKFLLTSNGTALTSTVHYGSITNNSTDITLPNGDKFEIDAVSFPSSLRYRSSAGATVNVKMTLLSVTYV